MLKQLLKNYPQVAQLKTKRFKPKSKLSEQMKLKLLKSWVRGGSKDLFCRMNSVDEKEYDLVVSDVIREAKQTGKPIPVSRVTKMSEGTLYLYAYCCERFNENAALRELSMSRSAKTRYADVLEEVLGIILERNQKGASKEFFKKSSDDFVWTSPKTGKPMNVLGEASMYSTELRSQKLSADNISAVLYCVDSFREFIHYAGDEINPPGTYEFRFENLRDKESSHGVA